MRFQWKEELETKTNNIFSVHVQHGKDKLKSIRALRDIDVGPLLASILSTKHSDSFTRSCSPAMILMKGQVD